MRSINVQRQAMLKAIIEKAIHVDDIEKSTKRKKKPQLVK
jgi:hypothetical protein